MTLNKNASLYGLTLAALALPFAFFAALLSELVLKQSNPRNIDVTADVAYLGTILWAGFGVFIIMLLLAFIFSLIGLKSSRPRVAKLSLVVIALIVMVSGINFLMQKRIESVEAQYSKNSIQDFFGPLREQLKNKRSE